MITKTYPSEFFSAADCVTCGQLFRYREVSGGYLLQAGDRACFLKTEGETTVLTAEEEAVPFWENYFDVNFDYAPVYFAAKEYGGVLALSAEHGKGIRIFRQPPFETLVCFLISQNNHIPRIRNTAEKLCQSLGEPFSFSGETLYSFPSADRMAEQTEAFYRGIGAGYRAKYLLEAARRECARPVDASTDLRQYFGVGKKVEDCVSLFAFRKTERFPVDTWLEKVYREDFGGKEHSRESMAAFFEGKFGTLSGFFQQYLFYYKRKGRN